MDPVLHLISSMDEGVEAAFTNEEAGDIHHRNAERLLELA